MKVKCVKILNADGREMVSSPWLKLEREYHVMGITISPNGERRYAIISSNQAPGNAMMGLHLASAFEIISEYIPSNWRVRVVNDVIQIYPAKWLVDQFFRTFFDGDPSAYPIFEQERDLIMREEP